MDTPPHPPDVTEHVRRANVFGRAPAVRDAMLALDAAARAGLDPALVSLVQVRASQINHCAWCLRMHTREAVENGVTDAKLHLVAAWAETTGLFSERERAALALTEAGTLLTDGYVPDEAYAPAATLFDETEQAQLIAVIATINAFNRISVISRRGPHFHGA